MTAKILEKFIIIYDKKTDFYEFFQNFWSQCALGKNKLKTQKLRFIDGQIGKYGLGTRFFSYKGVKHEYNVEFEPMSTTLKMREIAIFAKITILKWLYTNLRKQM